MSLDDDLNISIETEEIEILIDHEIPDTHIVFGSQPDVYVLASGNMGPPGGPGPTGPQGDPGPPGPAGEWLALTQAEYDALSPKTAETLYVIVA